jgi:hypothetical protein
MVEKFLSSSVQPNKSISKLVTMKDNMLQVQIQQTKYDRVIVFYYRLIK